MCEIYELAIIGMGPAGIGIATALQGSSIINKSICFERGSESSDKYCVAINNDQCCESDACHIISGIGGASKLSSGKISFLPAGSGLVRFFANEEELKYVMMKVIQTLEAEAGLMKIDISKETIANMEEYYKANSITYKYYDVYEFDGKKYRKYLSTTIASLIESGLQVHTNSEIITITHDNTTSCFTVIAKESGRTNSYTARNVEFAVGSSEIEKCLFSTFADSNKASYEIGVRVEAKSENFGDCLNTHGDLKLKYKAGRTYCVTRDGAIVSYKTNGYCLLEGYIDLERTTDYSNLAVLIKTDKKNELDEFIQKYRIVSESVPVRQRYSDYLLGQTSSDSVYTTLAISKLGDINKIFPNSLNRAIKEFIDHVVIEVMNVKEEDLIIVAPELKVNRSIDLSPKFEIKPNLYVIGAATGKFRGILQSFCSGIQCGKYILGG